jgi:glycosyltransferase involved in cell wall biosynthesis
LPVIVTHVGGLVEAVADYDGAILVPPTDVIALKHALRSITKMLGRSYDNPHSWERTVTGYQQLFTQLNISQHTAGEEEIVQHSDTSQSLTTHSGV